MSRRPAPWQRGFSAGTPRGLVAKLVQTSALLIALSLLFGAAASSSVLDDTPPSVAYAIDGIPGTNGWYRGSTSGDYVVVHWTFSDPESPITLTSGCEPGSPIGPNTGTTRTCSVTSSGGTTTVTTKAIKVDGDAPSVAPTPSRAPDSN